MRSENTESKGHARQFVEHFAAGWRAPSDPDILADHFEPWLDPTYTISQPLWQVSATGPDAFREGFARPIFAVFSDIRGTVESWSTEGDQIFIEVRLDATVGRRRVTLRVVDRVRLLDGRAVERVTYADVLPIVGAVLRSPSVWWRVVTCYRRISRANRNGPDRSVS